jgi:hypothetical protein
MINIYIYINVKKIEKENNISDKIYFIDIVVVAAAAVVVVVVVVGHSVVDDQVASS